MVCCRLKKFFDAQRVDDVGYSAVRTEKTVIILFLLSLFFAGTFFFLSATGAFFFIPILFIFPVYWSILLIGFKGATKRSPKLLITFFLSKAFFELALLSSLSFFFLFVGVVSIAVEEQDRNQDEVSSPTPEYAVEDRQYANPSGAYTEGNSGTSSSDSEPADEGIVIDDPTFEESDSSTDADDGCEFGVVIIFLAFFSFLAFVGLLHFIFTIAALILSMRTFCLIKRAQLLPLVQKAQAAKRARKAAVATKKPAPAAEEPAPTVYAPMPSSPVDPSYFAGLYPQVMSPYAQGGYHPMVYIVPMPPQEE